MPQGGIEETEDIVAAAKRELWEETGAKSVELIGVSDEWWRYEFPENYKATGHKLDRFRGQTQRWVAFLFTGQEDEFEISAQHTQEPQEFLEWRWVSASETIEYTVEFKVAQYKRVFDEFSQYLN